MSGARAPSPNPESDDLFQKPSLASSRPIQLRSGSQGSGLSSRSRRSSILNIVRRQSKSVVGIPFEDQVGAIDTDLDVEERLHRLFRICAHSTVKVTQEQIDTEQEDEENQINDLIDDVCSKLKRSVIDLPDESIQQCKRQLENIQQDQVKQLLPARVKVIRDYISDLKKENDDWKQLLNDHKEEYKKVRSEKKAVQRGESKLRDLSLLPEEDKAALDAIPDGCQLANQVLKIEKQLRIKENKLSAEIKEVKRKVAEAEVKNEAFVKKIKIISDRLNQRDIETPDSDFAQEVQKFKMEVQGISS